MRVVTMSLMEALSWLLYVLLVVLIFCCKYSIVCVYLFPSILFFQYALFVWMIPLNLNWSKSLYSHLFFKSIIFFCCTIVSFSFVYKNYGIIDSATAERTTSYLTALYFSVTTWSTLGYGDFRPVPAMRLLTSLEAILGILSMPLIFTLIWKYCDFRIWPTSNEDEQIERNAFKISLDSRGCWKQVDDKGEAVELTQKYFLNPCGKCKATALKVENYFETIGLVSPRMRFMVHCECGNNVFGKHLAMLAAHDWNKKNKKKEEKDQG